MATMSVSSINKGSDSVLDFCCGSCEEEGSYIEADFYCEKCGKLYCDHCNTPHKQLFRTHVTHNREQMDKWPVSKATENLLEKCEEHVDKKLKLFCEDHNQLCCSTCVLLNHRQCSAVKLISVCAKACDLGDFNQVSSSMKSTIEKLNVLKNNRKRDIQSFLESYAEQLQTIRDEYTKLEAALKLLEEKTVKALDDLMTNVKGALTADVDNCSRLEDELKRLNEALKAIYEKSKQDLAFIARKKCMDKIQQSVTYLNNNSFRIEHSVKFVPNAEIEQDLTKQSTLGNISQPNTAICVNGKTEFNVRTSDDSKELCDIECIVQVSNDQIVVGDYSHKSMKLLDKYFKVKSKCFVSDFPRAICQIASREVAVGLEDGVVQFISLNQERLAKDRELQLQHKCFGIAYHQDKLYITSGTALYQYTLSGSMLNKLYENTSRALTAFKCAVSLTGDKIYVTNQDLNSLLTLSKDGTLLSTFSDPELRCTKCVHVTPVGQVLVCGYSSNNILQVDSEGKKKLVTLVTEKDGLKSPQAIILNINTNSIIVGHFNEDSLLVFKVK